MVSAHQSLPRVVVAAPASGHGKTTVATGLLAALRRRGLTVSPHKVGPDYIDPGYHALAAGRPGRNLDPFLVGADRIAPLLRHGASVPTPADIAVVEGVMGLHDGAVGRRDYASTAHVARLIEAPVLLVLDTTAQGRSAAALTLGMAAFDPAVRIGGVILNRVGSPRHETLLRDALAEVGVPVLGAVTRAAEVAAPARHLGLVPVAERAPESVAIVTALAELVEATVDLDAVLALARTAPPLTTPAWDPVAAVGGPAGVERPRVALAGGPAFTFSYAETAELLTAAGADVVTVDPLRDPALPTGTRAVVIGGGFPEAYAQTLADNTALRAELAGFDGPIVAECAGLLYLGRSLDGVPMCGRLDLTARMTDRLTLGYREALAVTDSPVARAGEPVRGHEFHRTTTDPGHGDAPAWRWNDTEHGFVAGRVHASYLHTHWAGHPEAARRLVEACR
ncbi:Hydrogenobyrinic acid a,c-diamide synthase (glut amine-hydrolyzing) [Micromonospora saelicesensis]|uniref:Hydrogenobyrinate a,c-diamide synthase n=1 Tax=Micromonospora saelicesensis TaxID=285676 RepID=A0A328NTN2_9ACTN|nr:cobyrinate a,c-diamide synthase [Micromonospora saelicesensis]RAO39326.1 Hydrogenobyrinic acid a,c-diamide synthase (glut amine-hydrolyzing) [Micromonospora saelicesensis]